MGNGPARLSREDPSRSVRTARGREVEGNAGLGQGVVLRRRVVVVGDTVDGEGKDEETYFAQGILVVRRSAARENGLEQEGKGGAERMDKDGRQRVLAVKSILGWREGGRDQGVDTNAKRQLQRAMTQRREGRG